MGRLIPDLPKASERPPYRRSVLVIMAYGAITAAVANLLLRSAMIWTAGSAGIAILLALADIIIQIRSRSASS
ncbi:MAG TPA: hypothetical protein VGU74_00370 [Gemmatimonadales bacterium]|nr:hypothetical protein [Gemmatimonadales bacterium]